MKHSLLVTGFCCLVLFGGCSTTPEGSPTAATAFLARAAGIAVRTGAAFDLGRSNKNLPAYQTTLMALNKLIDDGNFDVVSFRAALAGLPVKEFRSETGAVVLDAATDGALLFLDLLGTAFSPQSKPAVKLFLVAVRDGLAVAVASARPTLGDVPAARGAPLKPLPETTQIIRL